MNCMCKKSADFKVINFCHFEKIQDRRYELYCSDCLFDRFSVGNCGHDECKCHNFIIVRECNWENVFDYMDQFRSIFPRDIDNHEENFRENEELVPECSENSSINTENSEDVFPNGIVDGEVLPNKSIMKSIYLYIKDSSKILYLKRVQDKWELSEKPFAFRIAIRDNFARIFVSRYNFFVEDDRISLRKIVLEDFANIPKFNFLGIKTDESKLISYNGKNMFFSDEEITFDPKSSKKRVYWKIITK